MSVDVLALKRGLKRSKKKLDGLTAGLHTLTEEDYISRAQELLQEYDLLTRCSELIASAIEEAAIVQEQFDCRKKFFQNRLQPAVALPTEILSIIFEEGLLDHDQTQIGFSSENFFLRAITSVCKTWRQAALGTPLLWSRIWCSKEGLMCVPNSYEEMRWRLDRSRGIPLHVSLDLLHYRELPNSRKTPGIALLVPHLSRLENLVVELHPDAFNLLASVLGKDMPSLTHLKLRLSDLIDDAEFPEPIAIIAPQSLTHIVFDVGYFVSFPTSYLGPLASNATRLELNIKRASTTELISMLEYTKFIEELVIYQDWEAPLDPGPEQRLTLPYLESLEFNSTGDSDFLSCVWCPALDWLCLDYSSTFLLETENLAGDDSLLVDLSDAFPNLQHLVSRDRITSLAIALNFKGEDHSIWGMDLHLSIGGLIDFSHYLAQRNPDASLFWNSLERLVVTIEPEMLGKYKSAPANVLVSKVKLRKGLMLLARISPENMSNRMQKWIVTAQHTLGDRFDWIDE